MALFYTEMLQLRSKCIITYGQPQYQARSKVYTTHPLRNNFKDKSTYSGMMTASTRKRMVKAIDLLMQISPKCKKVNPYTKAVITHQLTFITLTIHSPLRNINLKEGYKNLLKPFLRIMREKKLLTSYIWKAEYQERGQLHYHITTPQLIHLETLRNIWNGLLIKNKYLDEYFKEHNHYNANSTDIHAVHKLNDIQAYLTKYFTKETQNQIADKGKIWDCSANIKGKKYYTTEITKENAIAILKAHRNNQVQVKDLEKCSIIKCTNINIKSLLTKEQKLQYCRHLLEMSEQANQTAAPLLIQKE